MNNLKIKIHKTVEVLEKYDEAEGFTNQENRRNLIPGKIISGRGNLFCL